MLFGKKRFLKKCAQKCDMHQWGFIPVKDLVIHDSVRRSCEENLCGQYGSGWACPPGIGTLDECRARIGQYKTMILVTGVYILKNKIEGDPYANPEIMETMSAFRKKMDTFGKLISEKMDRYLILGNGKCEICKNCTYPDAPCRFPERQQLAIEGSGFIITELAKQANIECFISNEKLIYFGAILY